MTNRQQAFVNVALAWGYAYTGCQEGYKFDRALKCLQAVLDQLVLKLTDEQRDNAIKYIDKLLSSLKETKVSDKDYNEWIRTAMYIISNGKERWLNSCLGLALTIL